MDFFRLEKHEDGDLFAFIGNPEGRVNTLSARMLTELEEVLDRAVSETAPRALVFLSANDDNFIAGADIRQFEQITDAARGSVMLDRAHSVFDRMNALPFPVIAAIHGPCLGGGYEFALACHFRIATDWPKTIIGLPEVRLGLFPGAGGTQRLPRLIGVQRALPLMLAGRTVDARRAKRLRMIDLAVFPGNLADTAKRCIPYFLKKFPRPAPRSGIFSLDGLLRSVPAARKAYFGLVRRRVQKETAGNYPAPMRLIDCVEAGFSGSMENGSRAEAEALVPLVLSEESRAMRGLFFMQTALKKKDFGTPAEVDLIGVLGSGFMGEGIAAVSAEGGYRVALEDVSPENITRALAGIWKYFDRKVRTRRHNPVERDRLTSLVSPAPDYGPLARAGLIIEAVFEDIDLKRRVLAEAEAAVPPDCIFASNTSAIPIARIAEASGRPGNVIGMHYFSPVTKMPLLEVVVPEGCSDRTVATAVAVGRRQGKTVITVKDGPGFYTTRVLMPFMFEAIKVIEEGAAVHIVDEAMRTFGFPVGPLRLMDEVGLEIAVHVAGELGEFFSERELHIPPVLDEMLKAGYSGKKKGLGFYDYRPRLRDRMTIAGFELPRPVNVKVYKFFGPRKHRRIEPAEIRRRLACLMVNEAALCLQEGIIAGPEDGDIGAVFGLGFPPFLGGPFRYLDTIGSAGFVKEMEALAEKFGPRFEPAPILAHIAREDEKFYPAAGA